eukprot:c34139_g1_i1 orf=664-1884(+)
MAAKTVVLAIVMQVFFRRLHAQLYFPDVEALQSVRRSLEDIPGSYFVSSWDFSIDPCSFSGVLCTIVDGLQRVTILNLGVADGNTPGLSGQLSPALGNLGALLQLTLVPGMVTGPIPNTLGKLSNLQFLGLSRNFLSGSIPDSVANLKQLETLDLSYNRLTGGIPESVGSLPNLNTLMLCHNSLTGRIPSFVSAHLGHVDLKQNRLDGALPYLPSSLQFLSLSYNLLSGSLQNIASLYNLVYLDLSFNQLSGSVPYSIFGFKLNSLFLQRNFLSGPLQLTELVVIPTVDLSFNTFSGTISPFLAFVQNLYLNNNRFSGAVPQEFVDQLHSASIQTLFLQHNFLTSFDIDSSIQLPVSCAFCIQYNCMLPPIQSPCPASAGRQKSRPAQQCNSTSQTSETSFHFTRP